MQQLPWNNLQKIFNNSWIPQNNIIQLFLPRTRFLFIFVQVFYNCKDIELSIVCISLDQENSSGELQMLPREYNKLYIITQMSDRKIKKKITPFVTKLLSILECPTNQNCIKWFSSDTFVVIDSDDLSKNVLSKYFKHNNFSSFIRQLNIYGFEKVKSQLNSHYYHHKNFVKNEKRQLKLIQRKNKKNYNQLQEKQTNQTKDRQNNNDLKQMIMQLKIQNKQIRNQNTILHEQIKSIKQQNKKQMEKIFKILTNKTTAQSQNNNNNNNQSEICILKQNLNKILTNQGKYLQTHQRKQMQTSVNKVCNILTKVQQKIGNKYKNQVEIQLEQLHQVMVNQQYVRKYEDNKPIFKQDAEFVYENQNSCISIDKFF